ncbi:hypothetical protein OSSY52_02290 [Tepiditoga spiralis]|uniref:Prepilin-type N-terminal cleavage/methylation domain-containing protein n=1 Tax=Tepiditoga spiralis TaxID=2108365 RepID=A0A7G1G1R5_9BACT|nr:type II secretion system protein [Tepiditoga spiralis]BBE30088.1 hypothetical protein OSSY52_02290 [Tepiditoga spiralis]
MKNGFILIETVFELLIISIMTLAVLATFARTVFILKKVMNDIVDLNIKENSIMETIRITKNEIKNLYYYNEYMIISNNNGEKTGLKYNKYSKKLYRYKNNYGTVGITYIGDNITKFNYEKNFLSIGFGKDILKIAIQEEKNGQ